LPAVKRILGDLFTSCTFTSTVEAPLPKDLVRYLRMETGGGGTAETIGLAEALAPLVIFMPILVAHCPNRELDFTGCLACHRKSKLFRLPGFL